LVGVFGWDGADLSSNLPRSRLRVWLGRRLDRYFPAREVMFLGPGPISTRRFSQRQQVTLAAAIVVTCLWLVGASLDLVLRHHAANRISRDLDRIRLTTLADAERSAADRLRVTRLAGDLAWRTAQFHAAETETAALGSDLARLAYVLEHPNLPGENDDLPSRISSAVVTLAHAHARQAALSVELATTQSRTPLHTEASQSSSLSATPSERQAGPGQLAAKAAPSWAHQLQQRLADQDVAIERALAERSIALAQGARAEVDRARAEAERAGAIAERDQAEARYIAEVDANRLALAQLTQRTRASIDVVSKIVASTGLDLNHLAPLHMQNHDDPARPRGGPFVPLIDQLTAPTALRPGLDGLLPDVGRLETLTRALVHLPLSAPVTMLAVTSGFGYRADPFTGLASLHEGIDLEGARGTPILATAAGTVVFAGIRAEYGLMVEIDHGLGMTTRYGHLDRALVRAGDHITLHQEIGQMGASGRATGVHLHYEVRVDGVAQNPANFIKVSQHVHQ
jgi:murein DD-endopeptidase MepM/ murein hydrolase activator NlpD